MSLFDVILVIILFVFVWQGFRSGLVGAIGGFIGVILGIWFGSHYMNQVGTWIMQAINIDNQALANILAFVVIFVVINIIIGLVVKIINLIFHFIPFIDLINKMLGAIVGLLGGVLAISALVYLLARFPISESITQSFQNSLISAWVNSISVVIEPFIPEAIKSINSLM